jgi:hypothetical protein
MKSKNKEQPVVSNQLSFPDVTPLDHIKACPRYSSGNLTKTFFLIFKNYFLKFITHHNLKFLKELMALELA